MTLPKVSQILPPVELLELLGGIYTLIHKRLPRCRALINRIWRLLDSLHSSTSTSTFRSTVTQIAKPPDPCPFRWVLVAGTVITVYPLIYSWSWDKHQVS